MRKKYFHLLEKQVYKKKRSNGHPNFKQGRKMSLTKILNRNGGGNCSRSTLGYSHKLMAVVQNKREE